MTNSGKLFADELTEWLIKEGFIQSQCQMSIYYNYATDGSKIVVLSYVDDCVYWYTNEFHSSNCANLITLPVCSLEDVAYRLYVTPGRIAIASAYGGDVYDIALTKISSKRMSYDKITFLVIGT